MYFYFVCHVVSLKLSGEFAAQVKQRVPVAAGKRACNSPQLLIL